MERLLKRVIIDGKSIKGMSDDYKRAWFAGAVRGRETQRRADIIVATQLLQRLQPSSASGKE